MTGKLGVGEDSMTRMVMCARTPFFLTTGRSGQAGRASAPWQHAWAHSPGHWRPRESLAMATAMAAMIVVASTVVGMAPAVVASTVVSKDGGATTVQCCEPLNIPLKFNYRCKHTCIAITMRIFTAKQLPHHSRVHVGLRSHRTRFS